MLVTICISININQDVKEESKQDTFKWKETLKQFQAKEGLSRGSRKLLYCSDGNTIRSKDNFETCFKFYRISRICDEKYVSKSKLLTLIVSSTKLL